MDGQKDAQTAARDDNSSSSLRLDELKIMLNQIMYLKCSLTLSIMHAQVTTQVEHIRQVYFIFVRLYLSAGGI